MSQVGGGAPPWLAWALASVQAGLLVLDDDLVIVFANPWLLRRARLGADAVVGRPLFDVFPALRGGHFERRLHSVRQDGFPALLSETLHPTALPLYPLTGDPSPERQLKQSIQIVPTGAEPARELGGRYLLIQVWDVTPAVARERLLKQQAERMHAMAHIDALTDIGNRRHFDAMFEREWRHAQRTQESLGLVLFDVDHFKAYNDTYGHLQGDECLRLVAGVVEAQAQRPRDVVCRYGGEEIAMLLPGTDLAGALQLAHRVVAQVRAHGLPHTGSPLGVVTVSAGVACERPVPGLSPDTLILLADRALYQAKRQGRDRVSVLEYQPVPAP